MIPLLRVSGSHREVGTQLGLALRDTIRRSSAEPALPDEIVARCRQATTEHFPWVVDELDAAADAAGVDRLAFFGAMIEELQQTPATAGRCTDLVARSAEGHMLVAHNNDESSHSRDDVVAIEWRVEGQPRQFTLGMGPWLSVGWNETGLWVGGNELTPNDERPGIPRLLQMRTVLACRTIDEAIDCVLHPARASSYNWVFATPERAVNVEASATAAVNRELETGRTLVHTNHYLEPEMIPFEGDVEYAKHSAIRCERAQVLAAEPQPPTLERLREILSDHETEPDALCRHTGEIRTLFWCVADLTAGAITYGLGNPCESEAQEYSFH